jgi:uncharacterized protein (TIGR02271 family)
MTTRTITAIYDSETDARQARERLTRVGLDEDDVRIVSQNLTSSAVSSDSNTSEDKGMWESIKDFFVGDDDRPTYSEGLRRGGYLLTARVDDDRTDEAIAELEQTNAVDLDQRSEQWRSEGWTGTAAMGSSMAPASGATAASTYGGTGQTQTLSSGSMDTTRDTTAATNEQAIPIVEERLRVGKREVDRGGVRVRSYIVEEPVREDVSLREERVEVERRPVSDATARTGEGLLQERTIEISERGEEAVVAKDAVVTEEVVVRKTADERVESIDETLRHTEVDIDDTRTGSSAGSQGSTSTRSGSTKKTR